MDCDFNIDRLSKFLLNGYVLQIKIRAHQTRRLGRQSRLHGSEVAPTRPKSEISVALLF